MRVPIEIRRTLARFLQKIETFRVISRRIFCSTSVKARNEFSMTGYHGRPKHMKTTMKNMKEKMNTKINIIYVACAAVRARLVCAFAAGAGGQSATRRRLSQWQHRRGDECALQPHNRHRQHRCWFSGALTTTPAAAITRPSALARSMQTQAATTTRPSVLARSCPTARQLQHGHRR